MDLRKPRCRIRFNGGVSSHCWLVTLATSPETNSNYISEERIPTPLTAIEQAMHHLTSLKQSNCKRDNQTDRKNCGSLTSITNYDIPVSIMCQKVMLNTSLHIAIQSNLTPFKISLFFFILDTCNYPYSRWNL